MANGVKGYVPALISLVPCAASLAISGPPYLAAFLTGAVVLIVAAVVSVSESRELPKWTLLLLVPPALGLAQLAAEIRPTQSLAAASLHWAVLAAFTAVCVQICGDEGARSRFVGCLGWLGLGLALLATTQYYTSEGKLFWIWPSGDPTVFGPFLSRNNYATFVITLLPVLLWKASQQRKEWMVWAAGATMAYASVIVSGSRAGAILATAELPILLWLLRRRGRAAWVGLVGVGGLLAIGVVVGGWDTLAFKLNDNDPWRHRRELTWSALQMAKESSWLGVGLGTYANKYPAYAPFDSGLHVNFAHNDWAQLTAEAGIPAMLSLLAFAGITAYAALKQPWAVGVPFAFCHALVDYPLQRLGVALWLFAIGGAAWGSLPRRGAARTGSGGTTI